MKFMHETKSIHKVHVEFSGYQVRDMLLDKVSETLHLDRDLVQKHLRVDVNDGVSATSYVRGEVPMTRDEQLESLGLTPTEPVETDGAAVAESLGDHVTGTSDVVETPETLAAFEAVAGDPDQVTRDPEYVLRVYRDLLSSLRDRPKAVGALRAELDDIIEVNPNSVKVSLLRPIVEALERPWSPGPAVGDNPGVQLGSGEYAPQSEELPEVQVDRPESPATLAVQSVLDDLRSLNLLLGQAYEADMPSVPLEHAISHLSVVFSTLQKYEDYFLVEGGGSQRVVPRPVSEDNLRQARLKLAELINSPRRPEGRATATDLHYVLALLGGVL